MAQIITASNIVKPSSPTPHASKAHKLSFIDQIQPSFYLPLVFFYHNGGQSLPEEEISQRLKQSLSEILTVFYPLAGTVRENSYFDCDDRGVEFVEARVRARLSHFTENPIMEELEQLLPADSASYDEADAAQLVVKITFFDCGGVAVAVCFSHKTGDVSSFATFMNAWAATCRGDTSRLVGVPPAFDLALQFPPKDDVPPSSGMSWGITSEKILTRRLVFEREKLEKLMKLRASSRVEALSAFIWRSFNRAHKARSGTTVSSFQATHGVNFRTRAVPPLPEHAFGNCYAATTAVATPGEEEDEGVLVAKLRAAIRAVDRDYMDGLMKDNKDDVGTVSQMFTSENCKISSWWRFPVYEVDFGWGKPAWVCTGTMPYMNLVILMATPSRDGGIEAWINVPDDHFFGFLQAEYDKIFG